MSNKTVEFSLVEKFRTFTCKACKCEFLIFTVHRSQYVNEDDRILGPLVNDLHCPMCGEK